MANQRIALRKAARWIHLWLGLILGIFLATMGVTGAIVTLRPQVATFLSPARTVGPCVPAVDWNRAADEVRSASGTAINRIYISEPGDTRVRFRVDGNPDKVYRHVIFDSCTAKVAGFAPLGWMDWLVDFHHNLRYERTGRTWAGYIAAAMLVSSATGALLWLLSGAQWRRLFQVKTGMGTYRTSLDLHRVFGSVGGLLLVLGAFTSLWLCFPQTMRGVLALVIPVTQDARPARGGQSNAGELPLGAIISTAQKAIPDGRIREIRLPDGRGSVQVRMWREGDFRSLGNNVVHIGKDAHVVLVDLYADKPASSRIVQAMAALHYGEWGGLAFRGIYALAGFGSGLLLITGSLLWWIPTRKKSTARIAPAKPARADTVSNVP